MIVGTKKSGRQTGGEVGEIFGQSHSPTARARPPFSDVTGRGGLGEPEEEGAGPRPYRTASRLEKGHNKQQEKATTQPKENLPSHASLPSPPPISKACQEAKQKRPLAARAYAQ